MAFSERLAYARKQKKMKQADLGKLLDYLVKDGEYEQIDNITLKRLKDIEKLDQGTKSKIFDIIDTYLRDFKTRQAYAS